MTSPYTFDDPQEEHSTPSATNNKFRFSFRQKKKKDVDSKRDQMLKYISQSEAQAIDAELFNDYGYKMEQTMELAGLACAMVIAKIYPKETLVRTDGAILICCGPGNNGGDGLVCARHLKIFGYRVTVFYPRVPNSPLYKSLMQQCEKMDISFLYYMPSEAHLLDLSYEVIVDAVLGFNYVPPLHSGMESILQRLREVKASIVSIDLPSGWTVDGNEAEGLQPDCLISLNVPKHCARHFTGRYHFLAGRFLPKTLVQRYELNLPKFQAGEIFVMLHEVKKVSLSPSYDTYTPEG